MVLPGEPIRVPLNKLIDPLKEFLGQSNGLGANEHVCGVVIHATHAGEILVQVEGQGNIIFLECSFHESVTKVNSVADKRGMESEGIRQAFLLGRCECEIVEKVSFAGLNPVIQWDQEGIGRACRGVKPTVEDPCVNIEDGVIRVGAFASPTHQKTELTLSNHGREDMLDAFYAMLGSSMCGKRATCQGKHCFSDGSKGWPKIRGWPLIKCGGKHD
jgi:hypothetical protein